jgi:hypothetical protein
MNILNIIIIHIFVDLLRALPENIRELSSHVFQYIHISIFKPVSPSEVEIVDSKPQLQLLAGDGLARKEEASSNAENSAG